MRRSRVNFQLNFCVTDKFIYCCTRARYHIVVAIIFLTIQYTIFISLWLWRWCGTQWWRSFHLVYLFELHSLYSDDFFYCRKDVSWQSAASLVSKCRNVLCASNNYPAISRVHIIMVTSPVDLICNSIILQVTFLALCPGVGLTNLVELTSYSSVCSTVCVISCETTVTLRKLCWKQCETFTCSSRNKAVLKSGDNNRAPFKFRPSYL